MKEGEFGAELPQKEVRFKADSREEAVKCLDSCCEPELAQGANASTAEMQAKMQALRSSWKYRNAGLSYATDLDRAMVVILQQSEEAWARREAARAVPKPTEPVLPGVAPETGICEAEQW